VKENDIRPEAIFREYLELCEKDAKIFFKNTQLEQLNCPACETKGEVVFEKNGFTYDECPFCGTLYVNPRPSALSFQNFYQNSESSKFWATKFYRETEIARRKSLWVPKAKRVNELIKCLKIIDASIVDIGGGYGTFIEELNNINSQKKVIIEPTKHLSEICRNKKINVIEKFLENVDIKDLPKKKIMFTSFELFEHLHSPQKFLEKLNHLMKDGDYFYFTTLSGLGVDIQSLWSNSKSVSPPHHLNFFNPKSIIKILEKNNFKVVEVNTPGKLDIDIMNNNLDFIKDKFWKTFTKFSTSEEKEKMQAFLSDLGYSSHMEVICKK